MPASRPCAALPGRDWLRGPTFDLGLIGGVFVFALLAGGLASASPALFNLVLLLDLWLLAYPHVASTFTRVAFDRETARRRVVSPARPPAVVLVATAGLSHVGGLVALSSLYYYWQILALYAAEPRHRPRLPPCRGMPPRRARPAR